MGSSKDRSSNTRFICLSSLFGLAQHSTPELSFTSEDVEAVTDALKSCNLLA